MGAEFILYVVIAFIVAVFLSLKTDKKLLCFVLLFWILAQPVLNAKFIITFKPLSFDLHTNRILFFILILYWLWGIISNRPMAQSPDVADKRPKFAKYIYIYLAAVSISLIVNFSNLNPRFSAASLIEIIIFITTYRVTKKYITESVLEAILKAIIILSFVSALVAITQFAVDPLFLRTGEAKWAFGNVLRAFGIFQFDGDLSSFQALALIVILVRYPSKFCRYVCIPLLACSVFVAFHRLGYVILFVCFLSYLTFFSKKGFGLLLTSLIVSISIALFLSFNLYLSSGVHSKMYEQRIAEDTVSGRIDQYAIIARSIFSFPVGIGGYENPAYTKLMSKYGKTMMKWVPTKYNAELYVPYVVHNGFLAVGILYGFLTMLIFITMLTSMLLYFKKMISKQSRNAIIPFYAIVIWILLNMTQSACEFGSYFMMLTAILCGSFIAVHRTNYAGGQKNSDIHNIQLSNCLPNG